MTSLSIVLEFTRIAEPDDPHAFRFEPQGYTLRGPSGGRERFDVPWSPALLADIDALRGSKRDPAVIQRVGEVMHQALRPIGWVAIGEQIRAASEAGRPVVVTLRSNAAELYALPWELVVVGDSGQHLGEFPGVLLRHEWPGTATSPKKPAPRPEGGRLLFAWSAAGGGVPAAEHKQALAAAWSEGQVDFDPDRDVLAHTSAASLADALAAAEAAGRPFSVLHLLAHGGAAGSTFGLALDGEVGAATVVDAGRLRQLLAPHAGSLRLVVLAACDGGNTGALGTAEGGGGQKLVANRSALAAWETFTARIVDKAKGLVSLQACNGQYVQVTGAGVFATATAVNSSATFNLGVPAAPRTSMPAKIALRASNGLYVCAENGGGGKLVANRDKAAAWETFTVVPVDAANGQYALQASNNQFVCAENGGGGKLVADRSVRALWETFTVYTLAGNCIALKASGGQFVQADNGGGLRWPNGRGGPRTPDLSTGSGGRIRERSPPPSLLLITGVREGATGNGRGKGRKRSSPDADCVSRSSGPERRSLAKHLGSRHRPPSTVSVPRRHHRERPADGPPVRGALLRLYSLRRRMHEEFGAPGHLLSGVEEDRRHAREGEAAGGVPHGHAGADRQQRRGRDRVLQGRLPTPSPKRAPGRRPTSAAPPSRCTITSPTSTQCSPGSRPPGPRR